MKIEQNQNVTIEIDKLKNIKCDICKKQILKKGEKSGMGGSLMGFIVSVEPETEFENYECSDFCHKCYSDVVFYLKTEKKAKIPSYYYNPDFLKRLEEEEEEKLNNGKS